ncbi:nitrite/sulfite reductase [Anaerostipes faecalis]|uniref:nitrite/sulfite reductase n=1 Tax=Anaerostipes faecalis TaxID=2738446 RepID=UPI003EFE421B
MNQEWKKEIPEFKEKTLQFYNGEMKKADYKGFSGKFGSYAQKDGKSSMLRLRMAGGRLTKTKLKFIAEKIEKHQVNKAHLTTCQTVQLHNLQPEAIFDIMEDALDVGIVTMGGGGDFPRNTMVSPLSGVEKGEYFDVLPYAEATADYLLGFINAEKMPRKLKVCFSSSPSNVPHATFRDLGFVARPDGKFDVYSAGGLGNNPRFGLKVAEAIDPEKVLYYVCAMRNTFISYGNYEQRGKARTRYMQETLGEEGYIKAYQEKLEEVLASGENLDLNVSPQIIEKKGDGTTAEGRRIISQKQDGLYAVKYHPIGGCPAPEKFAQLYDVIKDIEEAEIRLSPDESMYIINLTGQEADKVLEATEDGAKTVFETSVSCIGASICQVGLRDSQALLHKVIEEVRKAGLKDGALPQIHISGCPSSCGTHQTGAIGFHGAVKVIDKIANPAFTLHVNGCDLQGQEKMGEQIGVILEKDIPAFLVELGQTVETAGMTYDQWMKDHAESLKEIAEKYIVK